MKIQHQETESKGSFYIEEDGKRMAEMTYSKAGDHLIIIDHTVVDDALRGQGAGKQLVETAVQMARERNLKIIPLCPYAKSVFDRTPEYKDVLQP